ncbi:MAG TPA: helix-turn-helix transcriptional regulator [Chloroflexota bacterium]|nr:helix-turn-helix transcriptional regulator [Chloroflexota bacterium]
MSGKFSEFLEEIEAEARAEGSDALAELAAFDGRYRLAHALMVRRREAGLSQAKLAKLTGVGQADISRIESGRANPTVSTLAAVAHALGCGIDLVPVSSQASDAGAVRSGSATAKRGGRAHAMV